MTKLNLNQNRILQPSEINNLIIWHYGIVTFYLRIFAASMKNSTKILIVDDEADTLEFNNYHLSSLGYEVKVALNGKLALEILQTFEPELILVDYMMPEMDGLSFLRHLKSKYPNNEYKIAFLTAKTDNPMFFRAG